MISRRKVLYEPMLYGIVVLRMTFDDQGMKGWVRGIWTVEYSIYE